MLNEPIMNTSSLTKQKSRVITNSAFQRKNNEVLGVRIEDNRDANYTQLRISEKVNLSTLNGKIEGNKGIKNLSSKYEKIIQCKIISDENSLIWSNTSEPDLSSFTINPDSMVTIANETATTKPEFIPTMDDPEISNTIKDPSRNNKQRLTKMHMIRGRFGGPGDISNLRLGTASSNNHHCDSHFFKVEKPIGDYLKLKKMNRATNYIVALGDTSVPRYLTARLVGANPLTQSFVKNMCPSTFDCRATFYRENEGQWQSTAEQQETVRLDVGS